MRKATVGIGSVAFVSVFRSIFRIAIWMGQSGRFLRRLVSFGPLRDLIAVRCGEVVCRVVRAIPGNLRVESVHCPFNPVSQLTTTVIGVGSFVADDDTARIRCPSGVTSKLGEKGARCI